MKRLIIYLFALFVPLFSTAQLYHSIEIDANSFKPVNTDALTGVAIDRIEVDNSLRPCARIKLKVNRMTRADIENLQIKVMGGIHDVMKRVVAHEGNGLIIELTAKPQTRFYLHHDKYGDSNEVTLNLEGNKEYRLDAELCHMYSIVVSANLVGADVYVDNTYKGKIDSNHTLTISNIMAGSHNLRVEHGNLKSSQEIFVSDTNIHFRSDIKEEEPHYVVIEVSPKDAIVKINGKEYIPESGVVVTSLHNGTYSYSVSANNHHSESGTFVVNCKAVEEKFEKRIELHPAYGWLQVSNFGALQDASVYVDGALIGTTPISKHQLPSGTHTVRITKRLYKSHEAKVVISDNQTKEYAPNLVADFATVTLTADKGCKIYVNNSYKGTTLWSGDLPTGTYIFEARKDGHRNATLSKTITAEPLTQSYTIPSPEPIYGTLNITTTPQLATVVVDGVDVGRTPLMKRLTIGEHRIELKRDGYASASQNVTIEEGETKTLNLTLKEAALATSNQQTYIENANCNLNMKMVWVEGGTFQMGATSEQGSDAESDEKPVHSVTLSSYYIAECEVTQAQWRAIMGNNPSYITGDDSLPVEQVSWNDAKEFCEKLSQLTGKKYALPTEAQWEYAARGGKHSRDYKYSGSNYISDVAWYDSNSIISTYPVKQKSPNELGLYDMSGNVWEWCSDWYGDYSSYSQTNPSGPSSGSSRVLRGGCWCNYAKLCRVSDRFNGFVSPNLMCYFGFRVVYLIEEATTEKHNMSADANFVSVQENNQKSDSNHTFEMVEQMPSFNGGDLTTFRNWVNGRLRYPQIALENSIAGRVLVQFVIKRDGSLTNIQVLQTPHPSLSEEVFRVLKCSPKWTPGKQRGENVTVKFTMPIDFSINY